MTATKAKEVFDEKQVVSDVSDKPEREYDLIYYTYYLIGLIISNMATLNC